MVNEPSVFKLLSSTVFQSYGCTQVHVTTPMLSLVQKRMPLRLSECMIFLGEWTTR